MPTPLVEELRDILDEKKAKLGTGKRFASLVKSLKKRGDVEDPEAVAASIGIKKYGLKKMMAMAKKGRKKGGKK